MAIALVQSVTGTGNLTLNGVAAGNALIAFQSSFRNTSTTTAIAVPTDTNGTFTGGIAGTGATWLSGAQVAITGIFYQQNAASGTHTLTFEANGSNEKTLSEFSGMATSGLLDVNTSAVTNNTDHTSQVTGTTGTTAKPNELVVIAHALCAPGGVADISYTDPVSGFTTLYKIPNDLSDVATFHAYKIISAIGTQSATFNWVSHEADMGGHAAIATFLARVSEGISYNTQIPNLKVGPVALRHQLSMRYRTRPYFAVPAVATSAFIFKKTLSSIGTKTGSRQGHNT